MDREEVVSNLSDFLVSHCGLDATDLNPKEKLFTTSRLSSYDLMVLMTFIDETYGIDIDTSNLEIEQLDTLDGISELVIAADNP